MITIKFPPVYDISHWKEVPNFHLVNPRPVLFITKATEDTGFVDNKFVRFFDGMKQIGVARGCYHFFRKAFLGRDQAVHFCNIIRPHINTRDLLILDVEEGGESATQLQGWLDYVRGQFPYNLIMIYSRKNILDPIPMTALQAAYFRHIPIWTSGYPFNPDMFNSPPSSYIPDQAKWGPVWLWQYTDKGFINGIIGSVDLDWISPTLLEILSITSTPEPDPVPPPTGDLPMTTYSNGLKVLTGEYTTSESRAWAWRAIIIPAASIDRAVFYRTAPKTVENVDGDVVANFSPFDANGLTLGMKTNGVIVRSYVDYNPFAYWETGNIMKVHHYRSIFNSSLVSNAAQGFRYLIESGVKNPRASADWYFRSARNILATNPQGDIILVSTKGISGREAGLNLHESVDLLFSIDSTITMALDGDGGGSIQNYYKLDNEQQVFRGDDTAIINVPAFMVIKLKSPTTGSPVPVPEPDPEPTPSPTPAGSHQVIVDFNDDGSIKSVFVDGVATYP